MSFSKLCKTILSCLAVFSLVISLFSGLQVGAVGGEQDGNQNAGNENSKILFKNQTNLSLTAVICEGENIISGDMGSSYFTLANTENKLFLTNAYVNGAPQAFDFSKPHNFKIQLIKYSLDIQYSSLQGKNVCNLAPSDKLGIVASKTFQWINGKDNILVAKGTLTETGKPTVDILTTNASNLNSTVKKITLNNFTYPIPSNSSFLDISNICVNGSLVNGVDTFNSSTGGNKGLTFNSPTTRTIKVARPNFTFSNPCDIANIGETESTLIVGEGLNVSVDVLNNISGNTKKTLSTTQVDNINNPIVQLAVFEINNTNASKICVDNTLVNETTPGSGLFEITAGNRIISPVDSNSTCSVDNTNTQTIKRTFSTSKKYTLKTTQNYGSKFSVSSFNTNLDYLPNVSGIKYAMGNDFCIEGTHIIPATYSYGVNSPSNSFYTLNSGNYSISRFDQFAGNQSNGGQGQCSSQTFNLSIPVGKYVETNFSADINPAYSISGLTLEGGETLQGSTSSTLRVDLGNPTNGGNKKINLSCTSGICKTVDTDLAATTDSNNASFSLNIEFKADAPEAWAEFSLPTSSTLFPNLSGTFLNGLIFNASCDDCIKSIQVVANFDKSVVAKYSQIGGYFSNSPWQSTTTTSFVTGNTYTFVATVNGSFKQFAFAGQTNATSLANTGDSIPNLVLFSVGGVALIGLVATLIYRTQRR